MEVSTKLLRQELAQYLSMVEDGNEITVTRNGKPIARLVPILRRGSIDLAALRKHHAELRVQLDHNPILESREQERY